MHTAPTDGLAIVLLLLGPAKVQTGLATAQVGLELKSEGNNDGPPSRLPRAARRARDALRPTPAGSSEEGWADSQSSPP